MVTAELAACLPVLVFLLAVGLSAVTVANASIRTTDVAREAARLAARHDDAGLAHLVAVQSALHVLVTPSGDEVIAVVTAQVRPFGGLLPSVEVTGRAVAAAEPTAASDSSGAAVPDGVP